MKTATRTVKCHTGPTCRLHGTHASSLTDITKQLADAKKKQKTVLEQSQSKFPEGNLRRKEDTSQEEFKELYDISREIEAHAEQHNSDEYNTVRKYAGTSYIYYNPYLRDGVEGLKAALIKENRGRPVNDSQVDAYIKMCENARGDIDKCFNQYEHTFKNPQLLYRAINIAPNIQDGETPLAYAKRVYQVGAILEDKAYASTSADPDFMTFFKRTPIARSKKPKKQNIVFEIVAKKGLPIFEENYREEDRHLVNKSSIQSFEREVLLTLVA